MRIKDQKQMHRVKLSRWNTVRSMMSSEFRYFPDYHSAKHWVNSVGYHAYKIYGENGELLESECMLEFEGYAI